MNTLEIKGDWNITKGKLKQKWATLTDDDLQYAEGKMEELLGHIQKRTGETREAVEKAIHEACSHSDHGDHKHTDEKAAGSSCCSSTSHSDHTHSGQTQHMGEKTAAQTLNVPPLPATPAVEHVK